MGLARDLFLKEQAEHAAMISGHGRPQQSTLPAPVKIVQEPDPCVHRGGLLGQLDCQCEGKPHAYVCSAWDVGKCILAAIGDQRGAAIVGDASRERFVPWSTMQDDRLGEDLFAGMRRIPACSLCDRKATTLPPPPPVEVLNQDAEICLITGYTPNHPIWRQLGRMTSATMRDYCRRHGYAFYCYTSDFDEGIAASWNKIKWLQRAIQTHKLVLWLDADAMITNPHQRLETLHQGAGELVLCTDPMGINCGAILIKQSPFAERFLQDVWNARNPKPDGLWEQDATHTLLWQGRLAGHLDIVSARTFNSQWPHQDGSYFHWRPGDFVAHVYRTWGRTEAKLEAAPLIMEKAVQDIDQSWIDQSREYAATIPDYPTAVYSGRGIVTAAGGPVYQLQAYVLFRLLRALGCTFPIECWYDGRTEYNPRWIEAVEPLGVRCIDAVKQGFKNLADVDGLTYQRRIKYLPGSVNAYGRKIYAILASRFQEALWLDADNCPVTDPSSLFESASYSQAGSMFWPDNVLANNAPNLRAFGLGAECGAGLESGQVLVDKGRCWTALQLAVWYNRHAAYFYKHSWGDKDILLAAWLATSTPLNVAPACRADDISIQQLGPDGRPWFMHRVGTHAKWTTTGENRLSPWYPHNAQCLEFVDNYKRLGL